MQPLNVVILQSDCSVAESLVSALASSSALVRPVQSLSELRNNISKKGPDVAILDLEAVSLSDVEQLSHEFPQTCIVCTHRLADEDLWAAALNAGAADVCPPSDTRGIVRAALGNGGMTQSVAA